MCIIIQIEQMLQIGSILGGGGGGGLRHVFLMLSK